MRKLLTAGIFGTILGIVGTGTVNASIVSSGFLDEKLTEYALSTSLDLKANQSDLTALSNKIGTLPTTISTYVYDDSESLKYTKHPTADVLGEFDNIGGLLNIILHGAENLAGVKILSLPEISTRTLYLDSKIDSIETKIGTLPSGTFPRIPAYEILFPAINQPFTYPTSLAELITALYGDSENGTPGLLANIIAGFEVSPGNRIGLEPNFQLAHDAFDTASANTAKIGTLPDGYDSVGAALTAIKGIAEEAKAAALAAIPDPKQEGSSGKFVLTVDIVGDNATYHWEKIDREGETTTTE